jgi:hypothetical protein
MQRTSACGGTQTNDLSDVEQIDSENLFAVLAANARGRSMAQLVVALYTIWGIFDRMDPSRRRVSPLDHRATTRYAYGSVAGRFPSAERAEPTCA